MSAELRRMDDREIGELKATVTQWMKSTDDFRDELRQDIKDLNEKLAILPCVKGHDTTVDNQLRGIWWLVGIALLGSLSFGVAWSSDHNQLVTNTQRWERYFHNHPDMK